MPVSRLLSLSLAMLFTVTLCLLLLLLAVAQTLSAVHSGQRFSEQVSSAVSLGDDNGDRAAAEILIPCDARADCFKRARLRAE